MSKEIQIRIWGFVEFMQEEEDLKKQDQEEFLNLIPESLKKKVLVELNGKLLIQNPLLISNFKLSFLINLATKIKEKILGPDETINYVLNSLFIIIYLKENEADNSFYIITKGRIELYLEKTNQPLRKLGVSRRKNLILIINRSGNILGKCNFSRARKEQLKQLVDFTQKFSI